MAYYYGTRHEKRWRKYRGLPSDDEIHELMKDIRPPHPLPDEILYDKEVVERVQAALQTLDSRERLLILRRFGLNDHPIHTLEDLAHEHQVSRQAMQKRVAKILIRLKYKLKPMQTIN